MQSMNSTSKLSGMWHANASTVDMEFIVARESHADAGVPFSSETSQHAHWTWSQIDINGCPIWRDSLVVCRRPRCQEVAGAILELVAAISVA